MNKDLLYQISLTQIDGIGAVQAKLLLEHFQDAESIFKASKKELSLIEGIGTVRAASIKQFDTFKDAENEISFIEKHHIQPLFIGNKNYPQNLLHCYDAPTMLYYRGTCSLNTAKSISIIGTRTNSEYGKQITEQLIEDLANENITVYSGLAFGIDAIAHKSAVKNNLTTIGVLAHGLDTIYPSQHKTLAKEMLLNGGLLTEFPKGTKADKHNFPRRNRIVAGIANATIVIETAIKGGSMITAELAYNYNRDVFAVPAKITDTKSAGCLKLIYQNKAVLLTSAEQLLENMGWQAKPKTIKKQRELFVDLSNDEKNVLAIIESKVEISIDDIYALSNLNSSSVAASLLNLELNNLIVSLPGKIYKSL
ncbi:MAG: DNA-processing protein DprA [Bacteroidetes bacterium]|jgi:DNA processing protein|nr:DNA-processing protein DprA [Bacteroidota bacterium]